MTRVTFDEVNGVRTDLYAAPGTGRKNVDDRWVRSQNVAPYIELNKERQRDGHGWNKARDMHHKASIPLVVLEHWLNEAGVSPRQFFRKPKAFSDLLRRKIDDPDWKWVRASEIKSRFSPVKQPVKKIGSISFTDAVRADQAGA